MLSMAPYIVFAPNIRRTQNTDTGRKTQTLLISALQILKKMFTLVQYRGRYQDPLLPIVPVPCSVNKPLHCPHVFLPPYWNLQLGVPEARHCYDDNMTSFSAMPIEECVL